jgi:hypothetical protein
MDGHAIWVAGMSMKMHAQEHGKLVLRVGMYATLANIKDVLQHI